MYSISVWIVLLLVQIIGKRQVDHSQTLQYMCTVLNRVHNFLLLYDLTHKKGNYFLVDLIAVSFPFHKLKEFLRNLYLLVL